MAATPVINIVIPQGSDFVESFQSKENDGSASNLSSYVGIGDGTILNVDISVFKNKDNRDNRETKTDMLLTNQFFIFEIEKNIDVGKIWEYCYIKIKEPLKQEMKIRLFGTLPAGSWEITDDLPDSYTIELEDI